MVSVDKLKVHDAPPTRQSFCREGFPSRHECTSFKISAQASSQIRPARSGHAASRPGETMVISTSGAGCQGLGHRRTARRGTEERDHPTARAWGVGVQVPRFQPVFDPCRIPHLAVFSHDAPIRENGTTYCGFALSIAFAPLRLISNDRT